jgi:integrase
MTMEAKFYLRKQGKKSDPVIILQVFDARFKPDRKFWYTTGHHINKADWKYDDNKKKTSGRPKPKEEQLHIIDYLDKLTQSVNDWGKSKIGSTSLVKQHLTECLDNLLKDDRKEQELKLQHEVDLFKIWLDIINTSTNPKTKKPITSNTRRSKQQTLNLVTRYCIDKGIKLTLENLDMKFYNAFNDYMKSQGLKFNSRGKHFKEIKAILREAHDRDYTVNQAYMKKSFKAFKEDTDSTYLNESEIKKLLALQLSPAKQAIRDLFVMACFVGVRHSDWQQINESNIVKENRREFLKIRQTKTIESIHIPVHPVVRMLLNKYNGNPPRIISNQKFNKALKEICKSDDLKLGEVTINGKSIDKWTEISTHTARRSFATNAYLSKSMSVYSIMQCTGHKSEQSFLKYLKLSGLDKATDIAESKFFNDEGWTNLKVA